MTNYYSVAVFVMLWGRESGGVVRSEVLLQQDSPQPGRILVPMVLRPLNRIHGQLLYHTHFGRIHLQVLLIKTYTLQMPFALASVVAQLDEFQIL